MLYRNFFKARHRVLSIVPFWVKTIKLCMCVLQTSWRKKLQETSKCGHFWKKKIGSVGAMERRKLCFNSISFHSFWIFCCMNVLPLQNKNKNRLHLRVLKDGNKAFIDENMCPIIKLSLGFKCYLKQAYNV